MTHFPRATIVIRIVNGGVNMPAFGNSIKPDELDAAHRFPSIAQASDARGIGNDPPLRSEL